MSLREMLDQCLAQMSPHLLDDPEASGAGVRVGVIDSGLNSAILRQRHGPDVRFGQERYFAGTLSEGPTSPHGTIVADVILSLAPQAELCSGVVFGPLGTCEVSAVIAAIRHAVREWRCQVLNLSLGVTEAALSRLPERAEFLRAIEEAYFADVLVVAAAHNDHPFTRAFPAHFATPLLSVDRGEFPVPPRFTYRLHERIEFAAHGQTPLHTQAATSWAAPYLSGLVARLLSVRPGLKPFEIKTLLYWLGRREPVA